MVVIMHNVTVGEPLRSLRRPFDAHCVGAVAVCAHLSTCVVVTFVDSVACCTCRCLSRQPLHVEDRVVRDDRRLVRGRVVRRCSNERAHSLLAAMESDVALARQLRHKRSHVYVYATTLLRHAA
eukprot:SAG11_NODE_9222_length_931_cov_2.722356_2_plen_124_part_00